MRTNLSAAQRLGWIPREVALQNDARLMPIIREIQAAGIASLNGIARALDERGIPTPLNANGWSGEQVRRMLARSATPAAISEAAKVVQMPPRRHRSSDDRDDHPAFQQ